MNVRRSWGALLIAMCGLSCGLQPVELRPRESVTSLDEVPPAAIAQLQAQSAAQGEETLQFLYPAPELVVPADLAPIVFEWRGSKKAMPADMPMPDGMMPMGMMMKGMGPGVAGQGAPPPPPAAEMPDKGKGKDRVVAHELKVPGVSMGLSVYVAAEKAALPRERWSQLLAAHSGSTLTVQLRGVTEAGAIVHAAPLQISVRAPMPSGLFYSFSTSSPGLARARLSDTHETHLTVPREQRCVGCHVISSDGKRMLAASAGPSQLFSWPVMSSAALRVSWPAAAAAGEYVRGTFDLAAARIAAAQSGTLLIFAADSGELLEQSAAPLTAAVAAPDWSPDGRNIVLETTSPSSIATVPVGLDSRLSELKMLIAGNDDEQLRAPRYSPDGEWIVYEKRMGPMRDARDSKLFLVSASGGEPIELRKLAEAAGPMADARAPAFAPADQPGHVYLLFSSRRNVGSFVPAEGQRQLFAAELDLSLAAQGEDPSHAAFWLPFQQHSNSYLQGQWGRALQADSSCDGDDCCKPAEEICGNNTDEDCDGAADESCDCAFVETCGNQRDDDCDLRTDEKPCMPAPPKDP